MFDLVDDPNNVAWFLIRDFLRLAGALMDKPQKIPH